MMVVYMEFRGAFGVESPGFKPSGLDLKPWVWSLGPINYKV